MPKFEKKPEGEGRGEWSEDAMKLAVAIFLKRKKKTRQARKQIRFATLKTAKMLPQSKKRRKQKKFVDYDNAKPCTSSNVDCIVCGASYEENWIQCKTRADWAYELCAEIDDPLFYYCDYCKLNN
ncbi:hypothetical protein J6590_084994 [Homalodisca vitripennis]|nr:hypothetical protein J6590_084994 [Homalodisca vitripennis]